MRRTMHARRTILGHCKASGDQAGDVRRFRHGAERDREWARPHKPPANVISGRKAAAMKIGGGKDPPKVHKHLEKEPVPHICTRPTAREAEARSDALWKV